MKTAKKKKCKYFEVEKIHAKYKIRKIKKK